MKYQGETYTLSPEKGEPKNVGEDFCAIVHTHDVLQLASSVDGQSFVIGKDVIRGAVFIVQEADKDKVRK